MAAAGLLLVLLFCGVHCYPYQQAYRMGSFRLRAPSPHDPPDYDPVAVDPSHSGPYSLSKLPGPVESGSDVGVSSPSVQRSAPNSYKAAQKTAASPYLIPQAPEQTGCVPSGTTDPSILPLRPLCEPPPRKFQAGDISHFESVYEHGNSQSESEDQQFPLPEVEAGSIPAPLPATIASPLPRVLRPEPSQEGLEANYGELFIAGKFPAGTITHFRTNYEHGNNQWRSAGFIRYYPAPVTYKPLFPKPGDAQDQGKEDSRSAKGQVGSSPPQQIQGGYYGLTDGDFMTPRVVGSPQVLAGSGSSQETSSSDPQNLEQDPWAPDLIEALWNQESEIPVHGRSYGPHH
ncbi:hypothetical protein J4Q44_G00323430 [Coregonus suidteri]|uniref:Uncharacterized protein n=1 Tax=Coregonus suidteri TaxID=861788 RepID=A0AAN8L4P6_9TELE